MRLVFLAVLLTGLGLSGFAVLMARNYLATQAQAAQVPEIAMTRVVVVDRDMAYGEALTKDDLKFARLPAEVLPAGTFSTAEELFPIGLDVPRAVLRSMARNEPVLASKVTQAGVDAGVAARLAEGRRAFAISVDAASGVSGFLRPNDRVDIFWTGRLPGRDRNVTKLIDTNVRIVAVDQSADEERTGAVVARTVTVEASPRQVAAFAQAQSSGRLSLALVGVLDRGVSEAVEVDQRDLLGLSEETARAAAPPERICTIRTRRGGEVAIVEIPCAE